MTTHTILVLADNESTSSVLRAALEPEGHAVLECARRVAALQLAAGACPTLVVHDLALAEEGAALVAGLRTLPGCAKIPILACSSAAAAAAGPYVEVLPRPVQPEQLVAAVRRHLGLDAAGPRAALPAAEETRRAKYRSLIENIPDMLWSTDARRNMIFSGGNVTKVCGLTHEQVYALSIPGWVERVHPEDQEELEEALDAVYDSGTPMDLEYRFERDGRYVWLHTRARVVTGFDGSPEIEGITSDVTERKRLEAEFRQAQRMEAVGQLAGGVAHDFNNILAIILANTGFLLADMHENDPRRADAEEVKQAAERAAGLTRQLLAFSRQQMLEQRVLELNSVVAATEKMLRRLIGEDIELDTRLAPDAGAVKADIGQIEQVIMNLVVNARDAMPHGGRLVIETRPHEIPADVVMDGVPVPSGPYVLLTVTDTGTGMDRETQRRIFEPFFTTKERGRGTGLGLSTCYGIVKQSGGYIFVTSELGRGTVFRIYLPQAEEAPEPIAAPAPAAETGGAETILLIEDDQRVRDAAKRILEREGYRVVAAEDAQQAITAAAAERGPIHLILSDVVMAGVNGPQLVDWLRPRRPEAKVLFMSGYTDHAVLHDGTLPAGAMFLQKPFASDTLAKKVRETLERRPDEPQAVFLTRPDHRPRRSAPTGTHRPHAPSRPTRPAGVGDPHGS